MAEDKPRAKLVLASASPRRLALLERVGLAPDLLCPSEVDETPLRFETPRRLAIRLAEAKARAVVDLPLVRELGELTFVLAADTVVGVGRRNVPKPTRETDVQASLALLSGRSHWVYSAVCLIDAKGKMTSRCNETKVRFKRLSSEDIAAYVASGEWRGKAGGYAIQGRAEAFVRQIYGSYSGVVGLPLYETVSLLEGAGFPVYHHLMHKPSVLV